MGGNTRKNNDVMDQLRGVNDSLYCIISKSLDPPFDLNSLEKIKYELLNKKCGSIVILKSQIVILLEEQFANRYSYAVQLDRLICILEILCNRLCLLCIDTCQKNILEEFLCILTVILNTTLSIVNYLVLVVKYESCSCYDYRDYIKCLICNLISEIDKLEINIKVLSEFAIKIINYELEACSDYYGIKGYCQKNTNGDSCYH